ncbi:hypothetical protein [Allochromatium tepidum]|uniref:Uncharacterized protein n=1 Tax=Allochromatium tepidum TaxID=553982 RepID=A0ABN6GEJ8_9GAMM|nr:hypothetical protein [Allochromatium tepidum]BCU08380.1 hypothetical protein Atep_30570 [Allochromatium tepidum]
MLRPLLRVSSLSDAIESGAAYIADMAQRFGDHSPIISLGRLPDGGTALVRSSQPLQDAPCPLHPLTQPIPAWLINRRKLAVPTKHAD